MSDAETLGWGDRWRAHLEVAAMETGEDLAAGRVIAVHRGTVEVAILSGARDSAAHGFRTVDLGARGHSTGDEVWPPVVGDWVGLRHVETPAPVIAAVLPRRTYLERPSPSGRSVGQPIAANIDVVLIVEPMDPTPSVGRVERFAAISRSAGAEAWLVLTKTDLVAPGIVEETLTGMGPWVDAAVGVTSADPASTERLRTLLPKGATAVLVGRSGGREVDSAQHDPRRGPRDGGGPLLRLQRAPGFRTARSLPANAAGVRSAGCSLGCSARPRAGTSSVSE